MILSIIDKLNEWIEPLHNWLDAHHDNPLLWLGLFIIGITVFTITYNALNRNG